MVSGRADSTARARKTQFGRAGCATLDRATRIGLRVVIFATPTSMLQRDNYYSPAGRRVTILPSRSPVTPQPAESKRDSSRNICAALGGGRAKATVEIAAKRRSGVVTCQRWRVTAKTGGRGVAGSHSETSSPARLDRLRWLRATLRVSTRTCEIGNDQSQSVYEIIETAPSTPLLSHEVRVRFFRRFLVS
jgi:hypothetical protein